MDATPLCPSPMELRLHLITFRDSALEVTAAGCRRVVACPGCGRATTRIHSRYRRRLADLPWHGLRVHLVLTVRKFFCDAPGCPRAIFTERLPATAVAYARKTVRAATTLEAIGFAVGGRPGARLAQALGLAASAATILAQLRQVKDESHGTPRVLGVDDWAMRRRQCYGTILLDLERHRVIEVLPDREGPTLAAWLRAHPGVEIVSRDRGGAYADATREAAPDAIQVADRFHLLRNLTEAVSRSCTRHDRALRALAAERTGPPCPREAWRRRRFSGLPNNRDGPTATERRSAERRTRRLGRYDEVVTMRAEGASISAIARAVQMNRRTLTRWLAAGTFPERRAPTGRRRTTLIAPFADLVHEQYRSGVQTGAAIYRALREHGYHGSAATVCRELARLRRLEAHQRPGATGEEGVPTPPAQASVDVPTVRQLVWLLCRDDVKFPAEQRAYVEEVCARIPALAEVRRLALGFAQMLKSHDADAFRPWIDAAQRSDLASFARGLERDYDAVLAAIIFRWSNGQVEGHVHRLKAIKRAMYGRAHFDLLRKRVLHHAA